MWQEFKSDLQQGQDMLNRCASLAERVCNTTAQRGQDVIHKEVQSLRDDWATFSTAVADVESNLESCIANWLQLDDEHAGFMGWLERMDSKVKALMEPRPNLIRKRQQLQDGEVMIFSCCILGDEALWLTSFCDLTVYFWFCPALLCIVCKNKL